FDPALGKTVAAQTFVRPNLVAGDLIEGPAIITEEETTVIVPSSREASKLMDGTLEVALK
ncbi:MAG: hypothetical protein ACPGRD_11940, partial [Planktomarina sp.]